MLHKYSINMSVEYIDSNKNVLSSADIVVGKAHTEEEAKLLLDDTKHSFVDFNYGISNNENVDYKRRKVNTNNFLAVRNGQSIEERIKNIEIIQNF